MPLYNSDYCEWFVMSIKELQKIKAIFQITICNIKCFAHISIQNCLESTKLRLGDILNKECGHLLYQFLVQNNKYNLSQDRGKKYFISNDNKCLYFKHFLQIIQRVFVYKYKLTTIRFLNCSGLVITVHFSILRVCPLFLLLFSL